MGEMDPWAMPQVCQGSKVCGCLGLDDAQLTFLSSEARCSDGQVVSPQPSLFWDRTSDFGAVALWKGPLVPPLQDTHVSWMVGSEEYQAKVPPHPNQDLCPQSPSEPLRAPQACWCLSHLTVMLRSPKENGFINAVHRAQENKEPCVHKRFWCPGLGRLYCRKLQDLGCGFVGPLCAPYRHCQMGKMLDGCNELAMSSYNFPIG